MIKILKAFRDALVADENLTSLVPEANVYAGLRDEKTALPAIDVFEVTEIATNLAGARVGGLVESSIIMQISIYCSGEAAAQTISEQVIDLMLGDNEIMNAAGIKLMTLIGKTPMRENNISHIPIRFRCGYHFIIT